MMSVVNFNSIRKKIGSSNKLKTTSEKLANKAFNKSKNEFLEEFNSHPITKELEEGPEGSNLSNTLGGIGNLFSFIGFYKTDKPIDEVRSFFGKSFNLEKGKNVNVKPNSIQYDFKIKYPNLQELKAETPMPWEGGKSWISSIERGISGFSFYMYKKFGEGRSGEGLQTSSKIRPGNYKPVRYISEIINNFLKNLTK